MDCVPCESLPLNPDQELVKKNWGKQGQSNYKYKTISSTQHNPTPLHVVASTKNKKRNNQQSPFIKTIILVSVGEVMVSIYTSIIYITPIIENTKFLKNY